ncbi:kelch repeat-containing protein, partial [Pyxidicoccus sp. 3LG]
TAELYDPTSGTWTAVTRMTTARHGHTATLLGSGAVLVTGGVDSGQGGAPAIAEVYDVSTQAWTPSGRMSTDRAWHTATLLPSGQVLVTGGEGGASATTTAELYAPSTGNWAPAGRLSLGRASRYGDAAAVGPGAGGGRRPGRVGHPLPGGGV